MKRIKQALLSTLSLVALIFTTTAPSFATTNPITVDFDLTPLAPGTNISDGAQGPGTVQLISDSPPGGDWTKTVNYSTNAYKAYGYSLKLPSSFQSACPGGEEAKVAGVRRVLEVKSADPNDSQYGRLAGAFIMLDGTSTLDNTGNGFDSTDTAPQGTLVGVTTIDIYYTSPITYSTFNDSQNNFIGYVAITAPATGVDFTATVGQPQFSAIVSCGNEVLQGSQLSGQGGGGDTSANSPKTGAGEVLIGTFLVALAATSFIVYKAIQKHRKTAELSEK